MNGSTVRLSDLCDLIAEPVRPGTRPDALYLGLEHLASGRLSRIGGGQASDMRSTTSAFQTGDVLYGKLRPYLDKAVIADGGGCLHNGTAGTPGARVRGLAVSGRGPPLASLC